MKKLTQTRFVLVSPLCGHDGNRPSQEHSINFAVSLDQTLSGCWRVTKAKLLKGVMPSRYPEISRRFKSRDDAEDFYNSIQSQTITRRERLLG